MSVINGRDGSLSSNAGTSGNISIRNWDVTYKGILAMGTPSGAGNMQIVTEGNTDWELQADFYGRTLPVDPGTAYTFHGYNGSKRWSGIAIVESFDLTWTLPGQDFCPGELPHKPTALLT